MANTHRCPWTALALPVLLALPWATVTGSERSEIILHVANYAGVSPRNLARAKGEVEDVFRDGGVAIVWREGAYPPALTGPPPRFEGAPHLTLLVVNVQTAAGNPPGSALGLAIRARSSAFVFSNRIAEIAKHRPVDVGVILGRVIAHEVGHLLLPPAPHAAFGIMRENVALGFQDPDRFTADEAQRIRALLRNYPPN